MENDINQSGFDAGGQAEVNQYKAAIDALRTSVNNLNKSLTDISRNVNSLDRDLSKFTDTVGKLNDKNNELGSSGNKMIKTISDLLDSFEFWKKAIDTVKEAFVGLEGEFTAGLALLTVFGPEILKWVTSLVKGKDAIDKAKISLDTLNTAVGSTDYSNAIKQVSELKINVGLAKKGLLEKKDVVDQYNDTLGKSMGRVSSLAQVEKKLTTDGPAYIKMTLYKAAAQLALQDAAKKAYEEQQNMMKSDDDSLTFFDKVIDFFNRVPVSAGEGAAGVVGDSEQADKERKAKAAQRRADAKTDADKEIKALTDMAGGFQKKAAQAAKDMKMDFWNNFDTSTPTLKTSNVKVKDQSDKIEQDHIDSVTKELKIIANAFAKKLELQHNDYATEQAGLEKLYSNKLITQDDYNKQSQQLEEKYHVGIGSVVNRFNKEEAEHMRQQQELLLNLQKQKPTLDKDQHDIDKAITPGGRLSAEKQMIMDEYDFEKQQAIITGKDVTEIEDKKQQELSELTARYTQQRKDFELQAAQQVSAAAFSIIGNNIKAQSDAKVKGLENDKAAELSNKNLTSTQKQAIQQKYKQKEDQVKLKAFKDEQKMSLAQAVINGALAITKATAQTGVFASFAIPGIIAETAIQVASILAQKPPAFAKGGHFVSDGHGALLPGYSRTDNTNAYLRSGEAVVVSEAMRNPWARNLVSAINVAHGGRDFSMPNTSRGYAVGGIFTDGGNANRYYNQPVNDVKDLANTLAYQMINNFPPIYVDVKDVNNQQNILAQTVNRVNL